MYKDVLCNTVEVKKNPQNRTKGCHWETVHRAVTACYGMLRSKEKVGYISTLLLERFPWEMAKWGSKT